MLTIASAPMAFRLGLCLQQSGLSSLETSWEVPAQCPETIPLPRLSSELRVEQAREHHPSCHPYTPPPSRPISPYQPVLCQSDWHSPGAGMQWGSFRREPAKPLYSKTARAGQRRDQRRQRKPEARGTQRPWEQRKLQPRHQDLDIVEAGGRSVAGMLECQLCVAIGKALFAEFLATGL